MARQKIVRAFRAKRSPVKAIRAVAAVARWQRYTDPETRQDYLYDEASGRSKWADGEVWTANSVSYAAGRLYHRTGAEVLCFGR